MISRIMVDVPNSTIILMTREFEKRAKWANTEEYNALQKVRLDYPDFTVTGRAKKHYNNQDEYKGLTYAYMRKYIALHDELGSIMKEFEEKMLIGECHKRPYPKVKKWFLEQFPEIVEFGMPKLEDEAIESSSAVQIA